MAAKTMRERARAITEAGSLNEAIASGALPDRVDVSVSEGVLLGLPRQDVTKFVGILGHGNTDLGEVLRVYQAEDVLRFRGPAGCNAAGDRSGLPSLFRLAQLGDLTGQRRDILMYEDFSLFIDNVWRQTRGGKIIEVIDPATEDVLGAAPRAEAGDLDDALAAARRAAKGGRRRPVGSARDSFGAWSSNWRADANASRPPCRRRQAGR